MSRHKGRWSEFPIEYGASPHFGTCHLISHCRLARDFGRALLAVGTVRPKVTSGGGPVGTGDARRRAVVVNAQGMFSHPSSQPTPRGILRGDGMCIPVGVVRVSVGAEHYLCDTAKGIHSLGVTLGCLPGALGGPDGDRTGGNTGNQRGELFEIIFL